jgi:4-hydroxy-3-methylbut-2-enyl diphosphate reductase
VESLDDLKPQLLEGKKRVAITSGASTPSQLTRQVIHYVEKHKDEPTPLTD